MKAEESFIQDDSSAFFVAACGHSRDYVQRESATARKIPVAGSGEFPKGR
jgi:hypothetical protein